MFRSRIIAPLLLALFGLNAVPAVAAPTPEVFGVQKDAQNVEVSSDGGLLSVAYFNEWTVWDVQTRRPLWHTIGDDFFLSYDGRRAILVEDQSNSYPEWTWFSRPVFKVFDARTGKQLCSLFDVVNRFPNKHPSDTRTIDPNADQILDVNFGADAKVLLVATARWLRRFDVETGRLIDARHWQSPSTMLVLSSAAIAPDGKTIVGASKTARVFDALTARQTRAVATPVTNIVVLSFDGSLWATQNQNEAVDGVDIVRASDGHKLWHTPECGREFSGFSADGKRVYATSKSGCDILDAHTGRKLRTLPGPLSDNFAPSPDGNWLYEARDGQILRWRAR